MNKKLHKFEIDLGFALIAITSSQKDYRVCYLINRQLSFNFIKRADLEVDIHRNSEEPVLFSIYYYNWEASETEFYLIANKGSDGWLIPEMRGVDFFLMIKNHINNDELESIISSLNRVNEIVAAVKIDPKKLKSNENLLF